MTLHARSLIDSLARLPSNIVNDLRERHVKRSIVHLLKRRASMSTRSVLLLLSLACAVSQPLICADAVLAETVVEGGHQTGLDSTHEHGNATHDANGHGTNGHSDTAGHGDAHHHPGIESLFLPWVNFLAYCIILFLLTRKKIVALWNDRREVIAQSLEVNATALKNAERRLSEAQHALSRIDEESAEIRRAVEAEASREVALVHKAATAKVERIKRQGDDTLAIENLGARASLRRELADLVLNRAEQKFRSQHNSESDKALRQFALGGVNVLLQ
jgi:F0F1-type ATP synthase membrane subunit b/b'